MSEAEEYRQYPRTQIAEVADWHEGFDMAGVSVSAVDTEAGSPRAGDKIARNPANHDDRWLVARAHFETNFESVVEAAVRAEVAAERAASPAGPSTALEDLRVGKSISTDHPAWRARKATDLIGSDFADPKWGGFVEGWNACLDAVGALLVASTAGETRLRAAANRMADAIEWAMQNTWPVSPRAESAARMYRDETAALSDPAGATPSAPLLDAARDNISATACPTRNGRGGFSDTTMGRGGYGGQTLTVCPSCRGVGFDLTEFEAAVRADERAALAAHVCTPDYQNGVCRVCRWAAGASPGDARE